MLDAAHPLDDPNLNKYVQDLNLVTRGPIWSGARWKAIWRFLTGQNGKLIDFARYRKGYVEVQVNAQAPILENAAHADRWKPIRLHFPGVQHWGKLEIHAKSGGELWLSFGEDDNLVQASLLPKTDLSQEFDVFLLDVPGEIAAAGFSDLVLRGEALTPDLWVFGVEGKE